MVVETAKSPEKVNNEQLLLVNTDCTGYDALKDILSDDSRCTYCLYVLFIYLYIYLLYAS